MVCAKLYGGCVEEENGWSVVKFYKGIFYHIAHIFRLYRYEIYSLIRSRGPTDFNPKDSSPKDFNPLPNNCLKTQDVPGNKKCLVRYCGV